MKRVLQPIVEALRIEKEESLGRDLTNIEESDLLREAWETLLEQADRMRKERREVTP